MILCFPDHDTFRLVATSTMLPPEVVLSPAQAHLGSDGRILLETPAKFAKFFSGFEFVFHSEVQSPEVFLATEAGDCDDYATLAAAVLKEKGYTPRLITVRMPKVIHVVCYIEETHSYLDYNVRNKFIRTVGCGNSISDIAAKVAASYHEEWSSASEFTYEDGLKRLVATVTEPPAHGLVTALFK